MIKPEELRMRNLVKYLTGGYGDEPFEGMVTSINEYGVCLNGYDMRIDYSELMPLTLDEEWFDKFGFNYRKYNEHDKDGIQFFYDYNEKEYWLDGFSNCRIKYVHQLQNLHFALTQTELEIKL